MKAIDLVRIAFGFVFAVIFMPGCSTYHETNRMMGGYEEVQLAENVFRISLATDGYTYSENLTDSCMLRCAELVLEKGFRYFSIVDDFKVEGEILSHPPEASVSDESPVTAVSNNDGQTYTISRPGATNTIVCHHAYPNDGFAYDAKFVFKSLRLKRQSTKSIQRQGVASETSVSRQASPKGSRSFPEFFKIRKKDGDSAD